MQSAFRTCQDRARTCLTLDPCAGIADAKKDLLKGGDVCVVALGGAERWENRGFLVGASDGGTKSATILHVGFLWAWKTWFDESGLGRLCTYKRMQASILGTFVVNIDTDNMPLRKELKLQGLSNEVHLGPATTFFFSASARDEAMRPSRGLPSYSALLVRGWYGVKMGVQKTPPGLYKKFRIRRTAVLGVGLCSFRPILFQSCTQSQKCSDGLEVLLARSLARSLSLS